MKDLTKLNKLIKTGVQGVYRVESLAKTVSEIKFLWDFHIKMSAMVAFSMGERLTAVTVQRAECIGTLLPVSIDPTNVSVTVSLSGFIPRKDILEKGIAVPGGGNFSIKNLNPDVFKLIGTESITKIPYLEIYDEKTDTVIGSTEWLVPTSYQDGGQGKGYVKADITLEGIGYYNGDYKQEI